MKRLLVVGAGSLLWLVLATGCVSTSQPTKEQTAALLIANQTPEAILGKQETTRIKRNIPAPYRNNVMRAEAFGSTIYAYDRLALDAGKLVVPDGRSPFSYPPAGWVTVQGLEGLQLDFIVKQGTKIGVAAEVTRTSEGLASRRLSPPRALSQLELALWKARRAAYAEKFDSCSKHYKPVVMPVSIEGSPFVYAFLLPASADPRTIYLGGYYRIVVSPDGQAALERHAFTHGCITLHGSGKGSVASVTEVVSDSPTAPQVYASLRYDLPIRVKTLGNGLSWRVENGRISLVSKPTSAKN